MAQVAGGVVPALAQDRAPRPQVDSMTSSPTKVADFWTSKLVTASRARLSSRWEL